MIKKEKKKNLSEKKLNELSDQLREEIFDSLPERLRKVVTLRREYHTVEKGVEQLRKHHGIFISISQYYKALRWLDFYIDFYRTKEILQDYIQYIFEKIGYFSNGKKKKGFEMFELIWEKPYLLPLDIATNPEIRIGLKRNNKERYDESYPRKIKQIYMQKIKEFAYSKLCENRTLTFYFCKLFNSFDKCVFSNFYSTMKKRPRGFIDIKEKK